MRELLVFTEVESLGERVGVWRSDKDGGGSLLNSNPICLNISLWSVAGKTATL